MVGDWLLQGGRMSDSIALVYISLPAIRCQGKCQASCGPIMYSDAEASRVERLTGKRLPDVFVVIEPKDLTCPLLDPAGHCSIYAHRPLICRLWGLVERMRCPWGCVPDRWLSDNEAR